MVNLSEASFHFLRRQALLFQGFALGLAYDQGMTPEEAGRRFWRTMAGDRPPRSVDRAELERIVGALAEDTRLTYGSALGRGGAWLQC